MNHSEPSGLPARFGDRLAGPARDHGLLAVGQDADHELGRVPRHRRVVPAHPGQQRAVRAEPGRRDEVRPRDQHFRLARRPGVEADDLVDDLDGRRAVVAFPHADDRAAVGGEVAVGEAVGAQGRGLRGERLRLAALFEPVEPLVGPVREPDDAVADPPRRAAVLVDGGARVEALRQQVDAHPVGAPPHELGAPALAGPPLRPHDSVPVDGQLAQPHRVGHHELGRERGGPGPVRRGRHRIKLVRGARESDHEGAGFRVA